MKSPTSFIGKCFTVLIGALLSAATVLDPDVGRLANALVGLPTTGAAETVASNDAAPSVAPMIAATAPTSRPTAAPGQAAQEHAAAGVSSALSMAANVHPAAPPVTTNNNGGVPPNAATAAGQQPVAAASGDAQVEALSARLRQLGATYVKLERLPQPQGARYNVRCDLAGPRELVQCSFESTRATAAQAMREVLAAVTQLRHQQRQDQDQEQAQTQGPGDQPNGAPPANAAGPQVR